MRGTPAGRWKAAFVGHRELEGEGEAGAACSRRGHREGHLSCRPASGRRRGARPEQGRGDTGPLTRLERAAQSRPCPDVVRCGWQAADSCGPVEPSESSDAQPWVRLSPDGRRIAAGYRDMRTAQPMAVWDAASGKEVFRGQAELRNEPVFNPDGGLMAFESVTSTIEVLETATGKLRHTFLGHAGGLWALAFNRDGTRLHSCGEDGTGRVWEVTGSDSPDPVELSGVVRFPMNFATGDGRRFTTHSERKAGRGGDDNDHRGLGSSGKAAGDSGSHAGARGAFGHVARNRHGPNRAAGRVCRREGCVCRRPRSTGGPALRVGRGDGQAVIVLGAMGWVPRLRALPGWNTSRLGLHLREPQ